MVGLSVKEKALREGLSKLRYCATNDGWQPFKPDEAAAILEELDRLKGLAPAPVKKARAKAKARPVLAGGEKTGRVVAKPTRKR